jgi:BASS family bile acid:Na+ symporter
MTERDGLIPSMKKSLFLFSAIALGILLPQGHSYAYLIRYFIMLILFCSLLDLKIDVRSALNPRLATVIAMMMAIGGLTAWVGNWFNADLALVAFIIAMAPTAAAAPVMTRFLQGRVDYVMSSVVVTNSFSALALPLVLPILSPGDRAGINLVALLNTLTVVLLPLAVAQLLQRFTPRLVNALSGFKGAGFYVWMAAIYLATAKATHFIEAESDSPWSLIVEIAAVALGLCILNFGLGRWLGGHDWGQEMGQSLGQKNTLFSIWVCLTFLTPAIALGPMFYIVFQNLYNSYLLAKGPKLEKV